MTDGDFTGDFRELSLFNRICESNVFNLDVLFFLFRFMYIIYSCWCMTYLWILNLRVESMFLYGSLLQVKV